MMKSFCSADKEKNIFNFPNPFCPSQLMQFTAAETMTCFFSILWPLSRLTHHFFHLLWACCVSDSRDTENTGQTYHSAFSGVMFSLVSSCQFVIHWKGAKWAARRKSCICLISCHSCFFSGPSFFCTAVAIRFGTPRDLLFHSQAAGASYWLLGDRSGGRKEADGSIPMSPCLLGRDVREQVEKDLLTHNENILYIHAHADALTTGIQCTHSHAYKCREL